MLHSFNLKLPVLKPIDFGREERRDEEGLAQEDGLTICSAEIVIEGSFWWVDPVGSLNLLRVEFSQCIGAGFEVVLDHHLVVNLILRLDKLTFSLLELEMEQVDILGLGEVPPKVILDEFYCLVN